TSLLFFAPFLYTPTSLFFFPPRAGARPGAIAAALSEARLIRDTSLFVDFARLEGYDRRFEAGVYFLNQRQSIRQIALLLTDSSKSFIPFRSVEGARIEELAQLVDLNGLFGFTSAEFLLLVDEGAFIAADLAAWATIPPGASLEGFMFPDTYQLPPDITAEGLRDVLLRTFRDRVGDSLRDEATAQGLTLYEAVTLASIIERESVWRDEQPMIASVYRNRLLIGMKLEADPTVQYGIQGTRESWWPQITRADYREVQSPYNTYLIAGLPPGPIASPGLSAIQAAIYPAESGYYFFRAACDNSHYHNFAVTFEEHVANAC
ncbi:MAG: endolytic transglycosylase MltG, partial [Chloroflexi bacterium]|nr:endolytic transglycosylase MltG [Chloroflexota bacterium]